MLRRLTLRWTRLALVWWFIVLLPTAARAANDQAVYGESLVNGWQDWSWCSRDLASAEYAHGGTRSVKVTYTGAWQGFYLHHGAFDTSLYSRLTFWIHGGTTSGRDIRVAGLLSDQPQAGVSLNAYVSGGAVVAGAWRQVSIPLSVLGVQNKPNFTGFWLQEGRGSAQPAFYVDDLALVGVATPSPVQVQVDATRPLRGVDPRVFGANAAVWDAAFGTPATVTRLQAMGTRILRFPGGSLSDEYHWATNTTRDNTWTWATSFDAFAAVAVSAGADAFITVNYGSGTPQETADWVRYSNITKGYGFRYWEIGNECYGDWEYDQNTPAHDPYTYAVRAKDSMARMKAVDPSIRVGVVVVTGGDSFANNSLHPATNPRTGQVHNGWTPVLLTTFRTLGVTPDFVIYHKYAQNPGEESDLNLLQSARTWQEDASDLRRQLADYLGAPGAGVEMVCTENNSVSYNPGKQTTSLVNGLFLADSVGQLLQTEFNALVWWDLRNGQEPGNNNSASLYGWRLYGDYGVLSSQNDAYPTFYVRKLLARFARGGETVVPASSNYALLATYAVRRPDGTLGLLVINKSPQTSLKASITLTGFTPAARADLFAYGIPQDEAARTGSGSPDVKQTSINRAASTFTYTFPDYSATVLSLSPAG